MASDEQRARRRAQREVAANLRAGRKTLPSSLKGGIKQQRGKHLAASAKLTPAQLAAKPAPERRSLAREAALDAVGKGNMPGGAPPAWRDLWYHDKDHWNEMTHRYEIDYENNEADRDADYEAD